MIFSELYSAYYNTVAKIMEAAFNPEATEKDLQRCVMEEAFSESVLTILPALKSGKWPLLHEDLSPVLLHKPTMPLTNLEKRWLKAIAEDPRVKLFDVAFPELNDVEPLFTRDDYKIYDQYSDGDPFQDEAYIEHFRLMLSAIRSECPVQMTMVNRHGRKVRVRFYPKGFEYSVKDDKIRIVATGCRANGLDVILMEEPENHLSFSTLRKMLQQISDQQENSQIIVATHNNMIASRLNLNNVLWITEDGVKSLKGVKSDVAEFFVRADDNAFLQLLLSKKVILVEGATEFLLLPMFYKQITDHTIEEDGISVISCNGISYKRYLEIAKATDKRIAVVTDNDEKSDRIAEVASFNQANDLQHIFVGATVDEWTWEACIYKENKDTLDGMIDVQAGAAYKFHDKDYGAVLGKMLNNKVDVAYQMLTSGKTFAVPQYVKDAIGWLRG